MDKLTGDHNAALQRIKQLEKELANTNEVVHFNDNNLDTLKKELINSNDKLWYLHDSRVCQNEWSIDLHKKWTLVDIGQKDTNFVSIRIYPTYVYEGTKDSKNELDLKLIEKIKRLKYNFINKTKNNSINKALGIKNNEPTLITRIFRFLRLKK